MTRDRRRPRRRRIEPLRRPAHEAPSVERAARRSRDELRSRRAPPGSSICSGGWRAVPAVPAGGRTSCRVHHVDEDLVAADTGARGGGHARRRPRHGELGRRPSEPPTSWSAELAAEQRASTALRRGARRRGDGGGPAHPAPGRGRPPGAAPHRCPPTRRRRRGRGDRPPRGGGDARLRSTAEARADADGAALRSLAVDAARPAGGAPSGPCSPCRRSTTLERALADGDGARRGARRGGSDELARGGGRSRAGDGRASSAAEAAQQTAIDELRTARDRVAALEPPPVGGDRLGASWQTLLQWAASRRARARPPSTTNCRPRWCARRPRPSADAAASARRARCAPSCSGRRRHPLPTLRDQLVTAEPPRRPPTWRRSTGTREQLAARVARDRAARRRARRRRPARPPPAGRRVRGVADGGGARRAHRRRR